MSIFFLACLPGEGRPACHGLGAAGPLAQASQVRREEECVGRVIRVAAEGEALGVK